MSQSESAPMQSRVTTIAVTSGKGGVGKSSLVVNLAVALAQFGARATVLDADYGLGNADILLGVEPTGTIADVVSGTADLAEIEQIGFGGVRLLASPNGAHGLTSLSQEQEARLHLALGYLSGRTDFLLVDTATGISANVLTWLETADDVLVVTAPEPTAIVDAYAVLKLLHRISARKALRLVVNQAHDADEASLIHAKLATAATEFLDARLDLAGHVVSDPQLADAVRRRTPLMTLAPMSPAGRCIRRIARRLLAERERPRAMYETAEASHDLAPATH